ncbi:MAG: thioesterase family protein [Anaerolineae bacterium]|nr:thioesterase family protein [Anaerolineae bacterium]
MKRTVESRLRVRYAETDAQGVVYYANYLVWFEVGRVNYFRALGFDIRSLEQTQTTVVIAEATCRYLAPARFDDEIAVQTWVEEVRRSSLVFAYAVYNRTSGQRLAEGSTVLVFVTLAAQPRPTEIPAALRQALLAASADGEREEPAVVYES